MSDCFLASETQQHGATGPLADLTVLEVSSVVMAPMAGRILAKLGAEVIRVESPTGDVMRRIGQVNSNGISGPVASLWDGKRSLTLDLKTEHGKNRIYELVKEADILLTNLLPKSRESTGLTWEELKIVNSRLIFCTAQGFSSKSPLANVPAYDDAVQAVSGVCDVYAKSTGEPQYAPYVIADKVSALTIVYSCLAALHSRSVSGFGQWVDIPMVDTIVDFNLVEQMCDYSFDPPLGESGWKRTLDPARKPHRCKDGWVCIVPYTDKNWRDFARLAGFLELDNSLPYETHALRITHVPEVQTLIADYARDKYTERIISELSEINVPVQPVNTIESLTRNEYLREYGGLTLVDDPVGGTFWRTSPNITFSETPMKMVRGIPETNEYSSE